MTLGKTFAFCLGFACLGFTPAFAEEPARKHFGKGNPFTIEELPAGKLKSKLQTLNPQARKKAMEWLHTFSFPDFDAEHHLRVDDDGGIFIVCPDGHGNCDGHHHGPVKKRAKQDDSSTSESIPEPIEETTTSLAEQPTVEAAAVSINAPPIYNSKPGAPYHIYLDFNGASVSGKAWSSTDGTTTWTSWNCQAWGTDTDFSTFSDAEQAEMRRVWERISEDYAPFDVNVTTDVAYDSVTYAGDKNKVGWLLFTATTDLNGARCPHYGSGGVAYVGTFGRTDFFSQYQPAWVTPTSAANMSEAASHEMGHNLGLSHDGTSSAAYYGGHAATTSAPSWGPIMGTGYGRNVSQWSKGEYLNYSNTNQSNPDDLAIMTGKIPYRIDDHGDTFGTSTVWLNSAINQSGIVERTDNSDYFAFTTGAGTISFNATTYRCDTGTWGANLDVILELYDSSQSLVASSNPAADVNASISQAVAAGEYYLVVKPSAAGTPLASPSSGYTAYGSLGQYSITGTTIPSDSIILTSPNGGEKWVRGNNQTVTWASGITGNVKIELFKNGVLFTTIAANTANDGSHIWAIPSDFTLGDNYRMRITSLSNPAKSDESLADFTIAVPPIYYASMDTNPGWSLGTSWGNGTPSATNLDGIGLPGPSAGYNGPSVMGYRLAGDYEGGITSTRWATTPAINCANHQNVSLSFWRWLGVEGGFDNAYIQVSNNGTSWTQVWRSSTTSGTNDDDGGWVFCEYDISAVADGQAAVYVRWGLGTTDADWNFCGWNLDEVLVDGNLVSVGPGLVITESAATTNVTEGGNTDTYTVKLTTQPTANVTVNVTPNSQVSVSPTSLTFTNSNWNTNQTVTVTAVNDTANEFAHIGSITHTLTSTDTNYNGVGVDGVLVYITDNDNVVPVSNAGLNQTVYLTGDIWSPTDLGPLAWYDASDLATITQSGGAVSQWNSKVGTSHMLQATLSKRPTTASSQINGLNAIAFDGSDDALKTASNPFGSSVNDAMFMAVTNIGSLTNSVLFSLTGSSANRWQAHAPYGNGILYFDCGGSAGTNRLQGASGWSANQNKLMGFYSSITDNVQQVWVDGTNTLGDTTGHSVATSSGIALGHDGSVSYDNCTFGEVVILNNSITSGNRQKLEGYLAHKWGLQGNLPAEHPYKSQSPSNALAVANLDGTVSDANGDSLTTLWTVVSGPGPVSFGNANAVDTSATFFVAGTYTLRLSSSDPGATTSDDVVITVSADGAGVIIAQSGGSTDVVEGGATDTYTVKLNNQPTANVTINVSPNPQVSVSPTSLTFTTSNWNTPQTVTVTAVNDSTNEGNHTGTISHSVSSSDGRYNALSVSNVTVNVIDDDATGAISIQSANYSVDEDGASVTLLVTRTDGSAGAVSANYATSNGTATAGSDYTAKSGTLNWAPGETLSKSITINITDNATPESNETFTVALSGITGATAGTITSSTVTITDNDPPGTIAIDSDIYLASESDGTVTVLVTRTGGSSGAASVQYAMSNGSATAGSDFTAVSGTLNWAADDSTTKSIVIDILNDSTAEFEENFSLTISNVTTASLGTPATTTVTISDNDFSPGTISDLVAWYDAQDLGGNSGTNITTWPDKLSGSNLVQNNLSQVTGTGAVAPTLQSLSVNGGNYKTVRFVPGVSNGQFELLKAPSLVTAGDSNRTVIVAYKGGANDAASRITSFGSVKDGDNGNQRRFWALATDTNGSIRFEGNGQGANITAHTAGLNRTDFLIRTAVMESATSFDEYIDVLDANFADTQVLSNGAPSQGLNTISGNFYIGDSAASSVGGSSGAATFDVFEVIVFDKILNNTERDQVQNYLKSKYTASPPTPPSVTMSVNNSSIAEAAGTSTITATLSATYSSDVTVNLGYTGTATSSGTDYTASAASITIPTGSLTGTATLTAVQDTLDEDNETIIVGITSVTNGTENSTQQQSVTITDDDNPPTVTLSKNTASIAEAAGSATLTATLSAASSKTVTVNLAYTGTANGAGTDYSASATSITVNAGSTTGTSSVTAVQDTLDEDNETIIVDITSVTNGTENGTQQQTVTITDDDNPPTVTLTKSIAAIAEASGSATLTATLSTASSKTVTVNLGFTGTATGGVVDYTASASSIIINAGSTAGTATVTAVQDTLDEDNETIIVDITSVTNGTENGTQQQTVTITDDDNPPTVTLTKSIVAIAEASGSATLTATLSTVSSKNVTVNLGLTGTATGGGVDYTASASSITINAGATSGTATVTAVQDTLDEDDETIIVDVTSVTNGTENGNQQQTVAITDDDNPPTVTLAKSTATIAEAAGSATLTATLSTVSSKNVTVNLGLTGTASGGGVDYTASASSIIINAGSTTGTATVTAVQDAIYEGNETIIVDITTVTNATESSTQQQTVTITDDDPLPTYAVTYNGNDNTSGFAPFDQTKTQGVNLPLASNSGNLAKTNYTFSGWNTAADGSGTNYAENESYSENAALTLYAKWTVVGVLTHTANQTASETDSWNLVASWNSGIVPSGSADVRIGDSNQANVFNANTPAYTGALTLGTGSTLKIINNSADINAIGTGIITMNEGSWLRFRRGQTRIISNPITLLGAAKIRAGESTGGSVNLTFNGAIDGNFGLALDGNGSSQIRFATSNSFASLTADRVSTNSWDSNWQVYGDAAGSLPETLTINDTVSLVINAANAMPTTATLNLNGAASTGVAKKLVMNANNTIDQLFIDGSEMPNGVYTNSATWLSGSGTLTVNGSTLTPYDNWTGGTFTNDFEDTLRTSDPDDDGLNNLLEFAFGMDPTTSTTLPLDFDVDGEVVESGVPVLMNFAAAGQPADYNAVFIRRKDHVAAGLTYTVLFSADLKLWTSSAVGLSVETDPESLQQVEAVSVPFPATVPLDAGGPEQAPRFFRVGVVSN